jgi:hypothetical protein
MILSVSLSENQPPFDRPSLRGWFHKKYSTVVFYICLLGMCSSVYFQNVTFFWLLSGSKVSMKIGFGL